MRRATVKMRTIKRVYDGMKHDRDTAALSRQPTIQSSEDYSRGA